MKLVIMIPCLDEAETLPLVFEHMPREIPGVDEIDYLVVDDGSRDGTAAPTACLWPPPTAEQSGPPPRSIRRVRSHTVSRSPARLGSN